LVLLLLLGAPAWAEDAIPRYTIERIEVNVAAEDAICH